MTKQPHGSSARMNLLKIVIKVTSLFLLIYFTASHWFFHKLFFNSLGIHGADLESPFVISQLQLIGGMVAGYALLCFIIARDLDRLKDVLKVVLLVGAISVVIFVGNVAMGTLPVPFLVNAGFLAGQIFIVLILLPKRDAVLPQTETMKSRNLQTTSSIVPLPCPPPPK